MLYNPDYTALSYRGRNLVLSKLQNGLNDLISSTWERMFALSGGAEVPVDIPVGMSEDIRSTAVGHSFINDLVNTLPTLSLLREMSKQGNFTLFRPVSDTTFDVDPGSAREFFHTVKPIVESIVFLLQVTGSGPLRMSEVVGDRYRNGSSPRNLFISHGRIFLLRTDLKSSTSRGHRSSVVHFPPSKVAKLLVYYLTVIRPLETFLAAQLGWAQEHAAYSEFIYVIKGLQLTPRGFSDIIATYSDRYFGCRLSGLDLRHVLINIQSTFLPPLVDPSVQKFGDSQAGHSTKVANHIYGQRLDHLPGQEASAFVLAYHWCNRLHNVLGVGPHPPTPPIPYLHAPSDPTWWSPSQYIPPPLSPENMVHNLHSLIRTTLAAATDQLARTCQRALRDATFEAMAALSSTGGFSIPSQPPGNNRSVAVPEVSEIYPAPVSFEVDWSRSHILNPNPSQRTQTIQNYSPPYPSTRALPTLRSRVKIRKPCYVPCLNPNTTTSLPFFPQAPANLLPSLPPSWSRPLAFPLSSPRIPPYAASLLTKPRNSA